MPKKASLPEYVYPCGKKFKVTVGPIKCENTYGETYGIEKVIKLSNSKDKSEYTWQTLYHEYLHAILHCTGMSQLLSEEQEEALVVAIEENTFHLVDCNKMADKS